MLFFAPGTQPLDLFGSIYVVRTSKDLTPTPVPFITISTVQRLARDSRLNSSVLLTTSEDIDRVAREAWTRYTWGTRSARLNSLRQPIAITYPPCFRMLQA